MTSLRQGFRRTLKVIDHTLERVESLLLAFGVLAMASNTIANVIGRFLFQESLFFTGELNRILIVVITFSGTSTAARQGRHIRMSAISDALPKLSRKILMTTMALTTSMVMFSVFWFSLGYLDKVQTSQRILPALQIPVWWIYVVVPVGCFSTGVQFLLTFFINLTTNRIHLSMIVDEEHHENEGGI